MRDQPEQAEGRDQLNQPIVQPETEEDWSELVGQAEHLRRPETEGQTEQQKHQRLEEHRAEPLDPQPGIGSQAEHQHRAGDWKDQAEKRDRGDEEEQTLGVTQNIRQSSAILDAVARYVGVPISNNHVPILNDNNSGGRDCQAEHWNQVQPEAEEDRSGSGNQAEPLRGSEARCQAEQQNHTTVQPETKDAWGGSVSRAEHLLRQKVRCQVEQQSQEAENFWGGPVNQAEHLNRPEEKCQAGPVGRAEHQPVPGKICQAEQQNHPKMQLEAGDGWGGSVTRAEHQPRSEEQSQADRGRPVSRAEHLLRSEEQCQAEQQNQPHVQRETEDDCWGGSVNRAEQLLRSEADCQAEQQRRIGQAEHPWADKNTHTVRQPTTIPVAVARQVDVPIITIREQILTLNAQADMDRGEQRKEDQAEQSDSRTDRRMATNPVENRKLNVI